MEAYLIFLRSLGVRTSHRHSSLLPDTASELWKEPEDLAHQTRRFPTESQSLLECIWLPSLKEFLLFSEGANMPEPWEPQLLQGSRCTCHKSTLPAHGPPRKQLSDAVAFPRNESPAWPGKAGALLHLCVRTLCHHLPRGYWHSKQKINSVPTCSVSLQRSAGNSPISFQNFVKKVS